MRKLALNDEILLNIEKPARYIGNEINSVMKDKEKVAIRFAMCFPDVYEIGMSHLGIQILYDMFNRREDTWCERVYSPWIDLDRIMREQHIPLFALESQDPIQDFDFLGITIQYEMCYTNILQVLDLSNIPLFASDRTDEDPVVIGGGPCAVNPEPLADFFDLFYIGEGETVYNDLLDAYKENKKNHGTRRDFLEMAAEIEGIYVPQFYDVSYHEDGTLKSFLPNNPHARATIKKQARPEYERCTISVQTSCPFHQGDSGPGRSRDPKRMYPRMPILSGGYDLPPYAGEKSGDLKALCYRDAEKYRTRGDFPQFFKFQRLFHVKGSCIISDGRM